MRRFYVSPTCTLLTVIFLSGVLAATEPHRDDSIPSESRIRLAVEKALPLLERSSAGSADRRTCFTCHSQALPVLATVESQRRGFSANAQNLQRQLDHTSAHLRRGKSNYENGRGQGGGVDTAGYALWTLEEGAQRNDDLTSVVVQWIVTKQTKDGYWKCSSHRPPSEASNFTTTYLAMRALDAFGTIQQSDDIENAMASAVVWLADSVAKDTEDQVFRLLALSYGDVSDEVLSEAISKLTKAQRGDGGWSQKSDMESDAYATATVLYSLRRAGAIETGDTVWTRAIRYLLDSQLEDGSWYVKSRSRPFQAYFETGFPHGTDQFISTTATGWATIALLESLPEKSPLPIEPLPATSPLDWPESDLSGRLMHTAHKFIEAQIEKANAKRVPVRGDSEQADGRRRDLRSVLGIVERRLPPRMERFGDEDNSAMVAETPSYQVFQVRWPVFANVTGEGLLVKQRQVAKGQVVIIPDANQSPEQLLGLEPSQSSGANQSTSAKRLADEGFDLVIPAIVSREKKRTDDRCLQRADYTDREWIYRQAFHMGRHVIGYDIQRVLAAIDWFRSQANGDTKLGVAGYGEGGLIALHAAAVDARVDATLVSGYFDSSDHIWKEPIYRNVWSRLKNFGNAEIASLIVPRRLVIEHSDFPAIAAHKGALTTPELESVESEFEQIVDHDGACALISGPKGSTVSPWSDDAIRKFMSDLGTDRLPESTKEPLVDRRASAATWIHERKERTTDQLETQVQSLIRQSEHVRDAFFLYKAVPEFADVRWSTERRHPTVDSQEFVEISKTYRKQFHEQAMGRFDEEFLPSNARTRKVAETDKWTAYDVVLDVHAGLFAWGVLVVPRDIEPHEKRPVIVCQHGRNGVPRDTIDGNKTAYNDFAGRLAERGFITFAPHNLYRGEDQYRWLDRKANAIGCTLFSFITAQHDATLRWLDSLSFVDGERIAFYGLSYGGETAVRVPTVLEGYCLSICSGDFNSWTRKVAATDQPFSFMNTIEWEMPYWNLGNTFDYAEMAYLMFPRPFMVERGHHDRVGRDRWVAHEFAKVRWLYAQFGLAERTQIDFFQGGHSIHGEATFDFLHEHLEMPPKSGRNN